MFTVNIAQHVDEKELNKFLNSPLMQSLLKKQFGRYGEVQRLWKNASGFHFSAKPLGSREVIEIVIKNIILDNTGTKVSFTGISSNMPWCHNLLADHVDGKVFKVSKNAAPVLMLLKSILKI